jgi:hypothetical protein
MCLPRDELDGIEEDAEEIAEAQRRESRLRQRQRGERLSVRRSGPSQTFTST